MSKKKWLDDWEKRPYERFLPTLCNRFPELLSKLLQHAAEGVFYSPQTLYNFACRETKLPVHFWYADPDTTSWQYEKYKGSKRRVIGDDGKPVRARKGYEIKLQTLPIDVIAWSAKSCKGAVNFGGELVVALEDMSYAADAGLMTEDELYRRGLVIASIGRGIMEYTDKDWVPQAYRNVGKPWPKSRGRFNGQRMKRAQYLDDDFLAGRNVIAHADLPRPNSHGDVADMQMGKICEIARNELNQKLEQPETKTVPDVAAILSDIRSDLDRLQEVIQ